VNLPEMLAVLLVSCMETSGKSAVGIEEFVLEVLESMWRGPQERQHTYRDPSACLGRLQWVYRNWRLDPRSL